jgi:hypothetical protein
MKIEKKGVCPIGGSARMFVMKGTIAGRTVRTGSGVRE